MRILVEQAQGFSDTKPITTGMIGVVAGWTTYLLKYLQLVGEVAASFGAIFGSIAALCTMLLVMRSLFRDLKNKKNE